MKSLKAAIFGLGDIAWRYDKDSVVTEQSRTHAFAYKSSSRTNLVAAFEPDENIAKDFLKKFPDVKIYKSQQELLNKENPDIVSICSPNEFHFEQAKLVMNENVPMLWLEKPPVKSCSLELEELINLSEAKITTCLVNYTRRYSPLYEILKKLDLKKIKQIRINYSRGMETNGVHMLDVLTYLCEDYSKFQVIGSDFNQNPTAILNYDGIKILISSTDISYHCLDFEVLTDDSRLTALYNGLELREELRIPNPDFPKFCQLGQEAQNKKFDSPGLLMNAILEDLLDSHEKKTLPKSNLYTSKATFEVLKKIRTT